MLTYKQKHAQANREALATVIGLAATIVVWTVCGFGLSSFDVTVFHTPLWVVGGTLGTWVFSILVAVVLAKRVFKNFDLDDETEPGAPDTPAATDIPSDAAASTDEGAAPLVQTAAEPSAAPTGGRRE